MIFFKIIICNFLFSYGTYIIDISGDYREIFLTPKYLPDILLASILLLITFVFYSFNVLT